MTDRKFIESALSFDPIAAAEEMVGGPINHTNASLAVAFAQDRSAMVERLMRQTGDVHWNCTFDEYCAVVVGLGFEQVYEEHFLSIPWNEDDAPKQETFRVYWHQDGWLLSVESYAWTHEQKVNSAKLYYNLLVEPHNKSNFWGYCTSSGSFVSYEEAGPCIWAGDHDVREALKHKMASILEYSTPLPTWHTAPHLWLLNYSETRDDKTKTWQERSKEWDASQASKITQFPSRLRDMLQAAIEHYKHR